MTPFQRDESALVFLGFVLLVIGVLAFATVGVAVALRWLL